VTYDEEITALLRGDRARAQARYAMLFPLGLVAFAISAALAPSRLAIVGVVGPAAVVAVLAWSCARRIDARVVNDRFIVENIEDCWVLGWADLEAIFPASAWRYGLRTCSRESILLLRLHDGQGIEVLASVCGGFVKAHQRILENTLTFERYAQRHGVTVGPYEDGVRRRFPRLRANDRTGCGRLGAEWVFVVALYCGGLLVAAWTWRAAVTLGAVAGLFVLWTWWRARSVGIGVANGRLVVRNFLTYANVPVESVTAVELGSPGRTAIGSVRTRMTLTVADGVRIPVDTALMTSVAERASLVTLLGLRPAYGVPILDQGA
jgi:hypothetical protein